MLNCDYGCSVTDCLAALVFGRRWAGKSANLSVIDLRLGQPITALFKNEGIEQRLSALPLKKMSLYRRIIFQLLLYKVIILERLPNTQANKINVYDQGEIYGYKLEIRGPFTELETVCVLHPFSLKKCSQNCESPRVENLLKSTIFPRWANGQQGAFAEAFRMLTWPYFTLTTFSHLHKILQHSEWWLSRRGDFFPHTLSA